MLTLRPDQIADLAYLIANPKTMLLHDPAVGKTPTVCAFMWYLWSEKGIGSAWAMPKSLMEKNQWELLRWTGFTEEDVCILDGTPAQIKKKLESGAKVFIMGFRRFTLSWQDLPDHVTALFGDEIHLNGWGGAESQNVAALWQATKTKFTDAFVPMTGTLVSGRLDTAYPSIHVIQPRYYANHKQFYYYHAVEDVDGNLVGWRNEWKLAEILRRHGLRRTFASVHGEENVVFQVEPCFMSEKHRELFDEFKQQAYLELDKFIIDGTAPGVGFLRARQLQEHPNYFPDLTCPGQFVNALEGELPNKLERLLIHFADHQRTGKPLVIFSPLVPQVKQISDLATNAGLTTAAMYGDIPVKQRAQFDRDFQTGKYQVLVCNPQVASVGFNWGHAEHFIFVCSDYMDTTILQAYRRGVRGKRDTPLLVRFMEYADSTDQRVYSIVARKSREANKVDPTRPIINIKSLLESDSKSA